MRVLLAFDKFKDCLTAPEACETAAEALRAVHPDWSIDSCPIADGGDGFAEILTRAAGGELRTLRATDPLGGPIDARFGLVPAQRISPSLWPTLGLTTGDDVVALVSLASASGLALVPRHQRDVWRATTYGTGELLQAAAAAKARTIVLGVGGSATHDLGLGALAALGLHAVDAQGHRLGSSAPASWTDLAGFSGELPKLPMLLVACDVSHPLTGPNGAAAVFAPQKGLQPTDVARLDELAGRVARHLCAHFGQPEALVSEPHAGAAGGISFGLATALGARQLSGFDFVAQWLGLEARIGSADIVITGEGRFDTTSLGGKGPGAVVALGTAKGKPTHVFAGWCTARQRTGAHLHTITPTGTPIDQALREASANLASAIRRVFPGSPEIA